MAFFDALRTAQGRYAPGVHYLPSPATEASLQKAEQRLGAPLPARHRAFLTSFDGGALFHEAVQLCSVTELTWARDERQRLVIGSVPDGAIWLAADGRLYLVDEETPDPICMGSDTEAWLSAVLAREALVVDRNGDFRDVFGEEGLSAPVRRKRAEVGLRHDRRSALYHLELAELWLEEDEPEVAGEHLQSAVALDDQAGPAWELLGALHGDRGMPDLAEQALVAAAAATPHAPLRAWRLLDAARVSAERAVVYTQQAWQADPELGTRLLLQAQQALRQGQLAHATQLAERLTLLSAVAPTSHPSHTAFAGELAVLQKDLRLRSALQTI